MATPSQITALLAEVREGRTGAFDRLLPLVYLDLRRIARAQLAGQRGAHTLAPTALVHEAYLRLVDQTHADWNDRAHFLAVSAIAMRQILLNHARQHRALKRGGERRRCSLHEELLAVDDQAAELLELSDALRWIEELEPRLARVVDYRFFGGLSEEETAAALGVTTRTVRRDWVKAKALLHEALSD